MQKHRFIPGIIIVLVSTLVPLFVVASPASAKGPYGSASVYERANCSSADAGQSNDYRWVGTWDLRRGGVKRPGIGEVQIFMRPSPSNGDNNRICAQTYHGSRTKGKRLPTRIMLRSQPEDGGASVARFWDFGPARHHSDGRAMTVGHDRCDVVIGRIKFKGKWYTARVDRDDVPDDWFCN